MEELPSEKDSPETLKAKLGEATGGVVPLPTRGAKFGKADPSTAASNPFGAAEEEDEYWALEESAGRLRDSFEALEPVGGFLSPQKAKQVLMKTGLQKEQLVCTLGLLILLSSLSTNTSNLNFQASNLELIRHRSRWIFRSP